jgi:hypothetical protein
MVLLRNDNIKNMFDDWNQGEYHVHERNDIEEIRSHEGIIVPCNACVDDNNKEVMLLPFMKEALERFGYEVS